MTDESFGIRENNSCRVCRKKVLEPILFLGDQYVVNFVDSPKQQALKVPLYLDLCNKKDEGCGLLQLRHTVLGDLLYRNFWYKSGVNQTMRGALRDMFHENLLFLDPLKEFKFKYLKFFIIWILGFFIR